MGEEAVADPAAGSESFLAGFSSDSLSRRRGTAGEPLHSLSRSGLSQRANLFRPGARKAGVLLCQRQSHPRRTSKGSHSLRRLLERSDGPKSAVAVLRLQADNLLGTVGAEFPPG